MNFNLKSKFILLFLVAGLVPLVIFSVIAYQRSSEEISNQVYAALDMYAGLTNEELNSYFTEREGDITVLVTTRDVYHGLNVLRDAGWNLESNNWQSRVEIIDDLFPVIIEEYGYAVGFITDPDGRVVYSSSADIPVGTDLSVRDYVRGGLAGDITWSELFYSDVINANCLVLSSPVRSDATGGEIIGTVNLLMDQQGIDAIVHDGLARLGESADAYLVDSTGLLLTNTLLGEYRSGAALQETINTRAVEMLAGPLRRADMNFSESREYPEYRGVSVLGQVEVVRLGAQPAGLIVEIDYDEAFAGVFALRNTAIVVTLLFALLIFLFSLFIANRLAAPIVLVSDVFNRIAGGDLTQEPLEVDREDEIGLLMRCSNELLDSLNSFVNEVKRSVEETRQISEQVGIASNELNQASQELSAGAEEQSSALQETVSSTDQMAALLEEKDQGQTTDEGGKLSKSGKKQIEELAETMEKIDENSSKIADSIDMINSITTQTNLLALNAAVEAANAGEHGAGFAVVAAEVRDLAQRSADAAKEIRAVVETNATMTEEGASLAGLSREVLDRVSNSVSEVSDRIKEIAAVTEENTAQSEETASSSDELAAQAASLEKMVDNLDEIVAQFKTN